MVGTDVTKDLIGMYTNVCKKFYYILYTYVLVNACALLINIACYFFNQSKGVLKKLQYLRDLHPIFMALILFWVIIERLSFPVKVCFCDF